MLFQWMKNLIMYLLLSGIAINLTPGKNYRRYISFFTGLVVIIIIMEPISYVLKSDGILDSFLSGVTDFTSDAYGEDGSSVLYDYYDMSLEEAIKQTLSKKGIKISKVSVLSGEDKKIIKVNIYLLGKENVDISENEIKKYLHEVYNLDIDSIYVIRR